MMRDQIAEICQAAVKKYGKEAQTWMAIEEMAELNNAIAKYRRERVGDDEVCEEIADVIIMCLQLAEIHGVDKVGNYLEAKLNRLKNKLNAANSKTNMAGEV